MQSSQPQPAAHTRSPKLPSNFIKQNCIFLLQIRKTCSFIFRNILQPRARGGGRYFKNCSNMFFTIRSRKVQFPLIKLVRKNKDPSTQNSCLIFLLHKTAYFYCKLEKHVCSFFEIPAEKKWPYSCDGFQTIFPSEYGCLTDA